MTSDTPTAALTAASVPPVPVPGPLTEFFWKAVGEHRLEILRCDSCGHFVHYPRPICDRCQGEQLTPAPVSGQARLYSWTSVEQAFHPYFVDKIPYLLAVVELVEEPGLHMTTNLVDCTEADLRLDLPLEVVFTDLAPGVTLPYFRPATSTKVHQ